MQNTLPSNMYGMFTSTDHIWDNKTSHIKSEKGSKHTKYIFCQSVIMFKIKNNGVTGKSQIFGIKLTGKEISGSKINKQTTDVREYFEPNNENMTY